MAVLHVTTLIEGTPQVIVPGVGDTYELIRDALVSGKLTIDGHIGGLHIDVDTTGLRIGVGTNSAVRGNDSLSIGVNAAPDGTDTYDLAIGTDTLGSWGAGYVGSTGENCVVGTWSGSALTSGGANTFLGTYSGGDTTSGNSNTFIGYFAGYNSNGVNNLALGANAMENADGANNIGLGESAGNGISTGGNNIMIGAESGLSSNGDFNVAIGDETLKASTGTFNVAIGWRAGFTTSTGLSNIMIGDNSGSKLTTGSENIGLGTEGLGHYSATTMTGSGNICLGKWTGATLDIGTGNVCIGNQAGEYVDSGDINTIVGESAGNSISSGSRNVCIGDNAGYTLTTTDDNVFVGSDAGSGADGTVNSVGIGKDALGNSTGDNNIGIGRFAGNILLSGDDSIIIGNATHSVPASTTDSHQLILGTAIQGYMSALTDVDYSGKSLTFVGPSALAAAVTNLSAGDIVVQGGNAATTGAGVGGDVIIKTGAKGSTGSDGIVKVVDSADLNLFSITPYDTGSGIFGNIEGTSLYVDWNGGNIGIMEGALGGPSSRPVDGFNNTGIGYNSGKGIVGGDYNIGIGSETNGGESGTLAEGSSNISIGDIAGAKMTTASDGNLLIGDSAGYDITTGSNNIMIGSFVYGLSTGSENLIIGDGAGAASDTDSHQVNIADFITGHKTPSADYDVSSKNLTILGPSAFGSAATFIHGGDLVLAGGSAKGVSAGAGGDLVLNGGVGGTTGVEGDVIVNGLHVFKYTDSGVNRKNVIIGNGDIGGGIGGVPTGASSNVGIGNSVLPYMDNGDGNVAVGDVALYSLTDGGYNAAVGAFAGYGITTGSVNSLFGESAGYGITTGAGNVCLGNWTFADVLTTGSYNIGIGYELDVPASDVDAYLAIGNELNPSLPHTISGYMSAIDDSDISGNAITVTGTSAWPTAVTNLSAGDLVLQGGRAATTGAGIGGDVVIKGGTKGSTGTEGNVNIGTAATSKIGFYGATPVDQAADTTAALTDITHTAPGTPDYAMQDMTNTTPYGFVTQDEANTLLSVVANLQARLAEVETVLADLGLTA